MALALIASTWPLWWSPLAFPRVPLVSLLRGAPLWLDRSLVVVTGLGLGSMCLARLICRRSAIARQVWGVAAAVACLLGGVGLVALDQHRLQPWFYQMLVFAAVWMLAQPEHARRWLIRIVISIYVYSAVGKFDFEFLHTVGQNFWWGMYRAAGWQLAEPTPVPLAQVAVLPLVELLLAAGLAWPRTRLVAGAAAIAFHLGLVIILGPLGLNHSWGVCLWNVQFAGQAWLLFVWPAVAEWYTAPRPGAAPPTAPLTAPGATPEFVPEATPPTTPVTAPAAVGRRPLRYRLGNALACLLAAAVITAPAAERWGYWDHWLSWALYAPHSSRVDVWVAGSAVDRLPATVQGLLPEDARDALWVYIPLGGWSLAETAAPLYPQARFQLGVAVALAEVVDSEFLIKAELRGIAGRWDGRRSSRELVGHSAIRRAADGLFWWNALPR